jgi:hypothetical protein
LARVFDGLKPSPAAEPASSAALRCKRCCNDRRAERAF